MNNLWNNFQSNWKSGLTVSLVSIPLSVSLAVASQSTPTAGIITAVWAGLMASLFGGSNFNIVGPTGALSGVLAAYAIVHGADALPTLAVVTAAIIFAAYIARLEKFLAFIPASTIYGFTLGVAFTIAFNQFNFAFGLKGLPKHEKFIANLGESFRHLDQTSLSTLGIFCLFLAAIFLLAKRLPKIPGAIILSPLGILLGWLGSAGHIPLRLTTLADQYATITPTIFQRPHLHFSTDIIPAAITVAVVAILETMISAKIADGFTKTKHNERKEMLGLGFANLASGLAGGIPATAALARTSLNIKSGANHSTSATISSVCIALISVLLLPYFKYIPLAVIASILVFVAARMIELNHFVRMLWHDRVNFGVAIAVAVVTVWFDPIIGILMGTAISLLLFVEKLSHGQFDLWLNSTKDGIVHHVSGDKLDEISPNGDILVYSIKGELAFINSKAHVTRFESGLNGYTKIVLRLRELFFIDHDGIEALNEIIEICHREKREVCISGVNPRVAAILEAECSEFTKAKKSHKIFKKTTDALRHFGYDVESVPTTPELDVKLGAV